MNASSMVICQRWARFIDYAVVFSSLYPLASYKFIYDEFSIGETRLLYPEMLRTPIVCYTISGFLPSPSCCFLAKPSEKYGSELCIIPRFLDGDDHWPGVLYYQL